MSTDSESPAPCSARLCFVFKSSSDDKEPEQTTSSVCVRRCRSGTRHITSPVVRMASSMLVLTLIAWCLMLHRSAAEALQDGEKTFSSLKNKRMFDSIEHSSDLGNFKRSFDSIGHYSDLDIARKRSAPQSDLDVNRRFDSIDHASDLDRLKKAFDSIEHMSDLDAKRAAFDSIDHFSDMAALKRVFDSIEHMSDMKRHFDSIGHYSDMSDIKRHLLGLHSNKRFDSIEHSSDMDNLKRKFDSIAYDSNFGGLKRAALESLKSRSLNVPSADGKRTFDSIEHMSDMSKRTNQRPSP